MMRAMVLEQAKTRLILKDLPTPTPAPEEVLIQIAACGVCRTDLHIVDGELDQPKLPLIPGHQIIGRVVALGSNVKNLAVGQRIGVPWLGGSCGTCTYCQHGQENLCDHALYTGYQKDGGFADYCTAHADYCFPLPDLYSDVEAAPLMCAGLIGYRCLRFAGEGKRLGFYGFGSAAHLLTQVAIEQGREVYAFTRPGDLAGQEFARKLGAKWTGDSTQSPPHLLDAAIIFAPVGSLVPQALQAVNKAGIVVCGGIHMSDIPSFPYHILWNERVLRSVANLTRQDAQEFLTLASTIHLKAEVAIFSLEQANEALAAVRNGSVSGAAVIQIESPTSS